MIEIKTGDIPCCVYVSNVINHEKIKASFLKNLNEYPVFSTFQQSQEDVYNTDYHINKNLVGSVNYNEIIPVAKEHTASLTNFLKYKTPIEISNYWYQQYKKNNYIDWHRHTNSIFSNVYYVDLPNGASNPSFRFLGKEFQIEVKEGQILTFPSFLEHCSKPNPSEFIKTVIAFNSN